MPEQEKPYSSPNPKAEKMPFEKTREFVLRSYEKIAENNVVAFAISQKPSRKTPSRVRRLNAALLYTFANPDDIGEDYQTLDEIGKAYGVIGYNHLIAKIHLEKAVAILAGDENLKHFRAHASK